MRELIASNKDIATRVEKLERNHDRTASVTEVLVEDIDRLGRKADRHKGPSPYSRRRIGYIIDDDWGMRHGAPTKLATRTRLLTAAEFQSLAEVPPEVEWFKNIRNASTKRAYKHAIKDFFTGIKRPEQFRHVTRAHVVAWRDELGERILPDGQAL
jgi:hypothetical protein